MKIFLLICSAFMCSVALLPSGMSFAATTIVNGLCLFGAVCLAYQAGDYR